VIRIPIKCIDKLVPLFQPARYKVMYGGRGSGKSIFAADYLIMKAAFNKVKVLCCREFQSSIKDSVIATIADRIYDLGLQDRFNIGRNYINSISGSEFLFHGLARNDNNIRSLKGINYCWVEEAEMVSAHSWEILKPTIREEDSEIIITFNPDVEANPTYQQFVVNKPIQNTIVVKINYNDNPYFPQVLRDEMENDRINNPDRFRHIWEGECSKMSNAVIFKDKFDVLDFELQEINGGWYFKNQKMSFRYGMDFGFSVDPFAAVESFVYDGELYICRESYRYKLDTDDIIPVVKDAIPRGMSKHWYGDGARPETISQLKRVRTHRDGYQLEALNIDEAIKGPGSIEEGIVYLQNFKKIHVHPSCKNMLYEFNNYKYQQDLKTGEIFAKPVDKDNHLIDALRYSYNEEIQALKGGRISQKAVDAVKNIFRSKR